VSQQGIARTQHLLNLVGQQFPSIVQAAETHGVDLTQFCYGLFVRSGVQPTAEVWTFIAALNGLIGPKDAPPVPVPGQLPPQTGDAVTAG
jgi:hypothetical protein